MNLSGSSLCSDLWQARAEEANCAYPTCHCTLAPGLCLVDVQGSSLNHSKLSTGCPYQAIGNPLRCNHVIYQLLL